MTLKKIITGAGAIAAAWTLAGGAIAFCGFYVAKADTKLFNEASKVVIVRDKDRTVLTMANDYKGDLTEFAMVIPVPEVLEEGQIHVTENALIDHLDAYTAPRLVEYFDEDPCAPMVMESRALATAQMDDTVTITATRNKSLGVTVEAEYTVGEYDIVILSAEESGGLVAWLTENEYKIPDGAEDTLASYIKQDVKFFLAKVNLEEQANTGLRYLRPLQVAFSSPKFMLPIRLGTVNAEGKQELFIFTLTREGRVETTNYRTVKLPSNLDIPLYVKDRFADFYRATFDVAAKKENHRAVFLEYAWDMNWCDPCAADPLSVEELRELGVYWVRENYRPGVAPGNRRPSLGPTRDVFVTRLHVRYDAETFPEDLKFKQTGDRTNFQGRYVLRHPYQGEASCEAGEAYRAGLPKRFEAEAQTLARLTDWDINDIREEMADTDQSFEPPANKKPTKAPWWKRLWGNDDKSGDKDE